MEAAIELVNATKTWLQSSKTEDNARSFLMYLKKSDFYFEDLEKENPFYYAFVQKEERKAAYIYYEMNAEKLVEDPDNEEINEILFGHNNNLDDLTMIVIEKIYPLWLKDADKYSRLLGSLLNSRINFSKDWTGESEFYRDGLNINKLWEIKCECIKNMISKVFPEIQAGTYYIDCRDHPILCTKRNDFLDSVTGIDLKLLYDETKKFDISDENKYLRSCSITNCVSDSISKEEAETMATEDDEESWNRCRRRSLQIEEYAPNGKWRSSWMDKTEPRDIGPYEEITNS
jgi:hypothetical protein